MLSTYFVLHGLVLLPTLAAGHLIGDVDLNSGKTTMEKHMRRQNIEADVEKFDNQTNFSNQVHDGKRSVEIHSIDGVSYAYRTDCVGNEINISSVDCSTKPQCVCSTVTDQTTCGNSWYEFSSRGGTQKRQCTWSSDDGACSGADSSGDCD